MFMIMKFLVRSRYTNLRLLKLKGFFFNGKSKNKNYALLTSNLKVNIMTKIFSRSFATSFFLPVSYYNIPL